MTTSPVDVSAAHAAAYEWVRDERIHKMVELLAPHFAHHRQRFSDPNVARLVTELEAFKLVAECLGEWFGPWRPETEEGKRAKKAFEDITGEFGPIGPPGGVPRPDAPLEVERLPAFWDWKRAEAGKDRSTCAAELRRALGQTP